MAPAIRSETPVVIVVAENVQRNAGACQQLLGGTGLGQLGDTRAEPLAGLAHGRGIAGGTRAHQQAFGVVCPHPCVQNVLVPGVVGGAIALWSAGQLQHVGLIHKFDGVDVHTVFMAESEDLFCLGKIQRPTAGMIACAVADRDQQLGTHAGNKVQDPDPLRLGQHAGIAFRRCPAGHAVKVIVGFCGPRAGHPDPCRAQLLGKCS